MPSPKAPASAKTLSGPQKALIKLGLKRDIDLALHLPLRYEYETRIIKLRDAREGDATQIEATVTACESTTRPRRLLLVRNSARCRCEWRIRAAAYRSPAKSKRSSKC